MLDSGLRIALDPLFPPPNFNKRANLSHIPLTLWELVFDEDIDKKELDELFQKHYEKQYSSQESSKVQDLEAELIKEEDQEDDFDL